MSNPKNVEIISTVTVTKRGGVVHRVKHASSSTGTDMTFAIFLPAVHKIGSTKSNALPAIYWLSGLTCTDQNFAQKAGGNAFAKADEEGIAIVLPDTSPRGEVVPDDDAYDLGVGAGFYIDATNPPWDKHYKMGTYVSRELPGLVEAEWGVGRDGCRSICGHSMGGHGALTFALKSPNGKAVLVVVCIDKLGSIVR